MAAGKRPYPRRRKLQVQLKHDVEVELRPARLEPSRSLRFLDLDKLARRAHARIEIGRVKGACGAQSVIATVRKGEVMSIDVEGCCGGRKKGAPSLELPPGLRRAVDRAVRELTPPKKAAASLSGSIGDLAFGGIVLSTWTCWEVCIRIFGIYYCMTCCVGEGPPKGRTWDACSPIETIGI